MACKQQTWLNVGQQDSINTYVRCMQSNGKMSLQSEKYRLDEVEFLFCAREVLSLGMRCSYFLSGVSGNSYFLKFVFSFLTALHIPTQIGICKEEKKISYKVCVCVYELFAVVCVKKENEIKSQSYNLVKMFVIVDMGTATLRYYIKLLHVCSWNGVGHDVGERIFITLRVGTVTLELAGCFWFLWVLFIFI